MRLQKAFFPRKIYWLNLTSRITRSILYEMYLPNRNVGDCIQLQTTSIDIKRIRRVIQDLLRVDADQQHSNSRVKWVNLTSSFQSYIRTRIFNNLAHIAIHQFLNSAFFLIKYRIRNCLKTMTPKKIVIFSLSKEFIRKMLKFWIINIWRQKILLWVLDEIGRYGIQTMV